MKRYLVLEPINIGQGVLRPGRELFLEEAAAVSEVAARRLQEVDDAESDEARAARELQQAEVAAQAALLTATTSLVSSAAADLQPDLLAGASTETPLEVKVQVGEQLIDISIIGQDADGQPIVTDDSFARLQEAVQTLKPATPPQKKPADKKPAAAKKGK